MQPKMRGQPIPNSKTTKIDFLVLFLIGLMLTYSAAIFLSAYLSGPDTGAWVWERRQNLFFWY